MKFWDAFRESVVLQAILSVALWGAAIYLMLVDKPIPEMLALGCGVIMTFWFTSKVRRDVINQLRK